MIHFFRGLAILAGPTIGYLKISPDGKGILIGVVAALLIIGVEIIINQIPLGTMVAGGIGAVSGLILALLLDRAIDLLNDPQLTNIADKYSLLTKIVFVYLGMVFFVRKYPELGQLDKDILVKNAPRRNQEVIVLDTSSLIDGRVADICDTKFLGGTMVVPHFVLTELQNVADSSDAHRRARGRRGLDVVKHMQDNPDIKLKLFEKDYSGISTVDEKIIALSKDLSAKVLTTDFNLNKLASLQGVDVLNVNDLASSLRPIALPGDTMTIYIVKDGKEKDQGVGFLDDGTMVVVEDGRKLMGKGKPTEVTVASILQTSSGRMIFARHKERSPSHNSPSRN